MAGERALPGLGLFGYWTLGSSGYKTQMDGNFRLLSALVQPCVVSSVATVPGSPTDGDIHRLTGAPNQHDIAVRDNGAWVYITPAEGWQIYDRATNERLLFDGTTWVVLGAALTPIESIIIAVGDETTVLTAGTNKVSFRMPYAFTLTDIKASLNVAQASGSIVTVDVNEAGASILSTKLTFDNTELTTVTATAARVISDTTLAADALITIDIDQVGAATVAAGLKVTLIGRQ